ncbi:hypothetical protein Vretimale_10003 [Volvox reticuliferus]|uniref:Protein BIG1 n=1 Tax=Volvox reticuliferus TaxID=1737510 RepID=A0A8J4CY63_9CHLO|nr:hypothetical protein Vretifemale_18860 [Volvox reticuliferus]GIM05538.1 hypothetical protein Vretimale_10003 [Volvox reticuliferus]
MKLCAATFALCLLSVALAEDAGLSAPILAWSNRGLISEGKHVSYEVFPDVEQVTADLVLGALGQAQGNDFGLRDFPAEDLRPDESRKVVIFIGSQLDAADMRSRSDAISNLDGIISGAVSSLALPYTFSKGISISETLCTKLDSAGIKHEGVGCSAPSSDIKADAGTALAEGNTVVLVCSHVEDALKGTNAGLEAEVEQLKAVQAAVVEADVNHMFVYATEAKPQTGLLAAGNKRRSLLQESDPMACGPLCQTQVRWLEGMLAVLVMALASCAGLVCLYVLDTPTRFESPNKDAAPQQ